MADLGAWERSADVAVREIGAADAGRIAEIDRSESIDALHEVRGGAIVSLGRGCEADRWHGDWLARQIEFVRRHLEDGATALGAFAGGRLVAVGILGHAPVRGAADELQLVFMHVSRDYRRRGIARGLVTRLAATARRRGARRLYISATPSSSALGLYLGLGAELADPVDPDLFALEPEDVHLVLEL